MFFLSQSQLVRDCLKRVLKVGAVTAGCSWGQLEAVELNSVASSPNNVTVDLSSMQYTNSVLWTNGLSGVLNNNSGAVLDNENVLRNYGTLNNNSGAILINQLVLLNYSGSTLNNNSGSVIDNEFILNNLSISTLYPSKLEKRLDRAINQLSNWSGSSNSPKFIPDAISKVFA